MKRPPLFFFFFFFFFFFLFRCDRSECVICVQHWYLYLPVILISKAFDRVQHQQLVILAGVGVEGTALDWFVSYLLVSHRRQQVKSGISLGEVKVCSRGVPQGSVLGPLLFTLYTRHLPALLTLSRRDETRTLMTLTWSYFPPETCTVNPEYSSNVT